MEYEFYLDLFFLWVFFLDLLALYLASCLGRIPMRVPGFLAAAGSRKRLQLRPCCVSCPSGSGRAFSGGSPGSEASCAGWLFLLGRLESS